MDIYTLEVKAWALFVRGLATVREPKYEASALDVHLSAATTRIAFYTRTSILVSRNEKRSGLAATLQAQKCAPTISELH